MVQEKIKNNRKHSENLSPSTPLTKFCFWRQKDIFQLCWRADSKPRWPHLGPQRISHRNQLGLSQPTSRGKRRKHFLRQNFKDFYFQEEKSSCPTTAPAGKGRSWKLSSFLKFDFETNRLAAIFE